MSAVTHPPAVNARGCGPETLTDRAKAISHPRGPLSIHPESDVVDDKTRDPRTMKKSMSATTNSSSPVARVESVTKIYETGSENVHALDSVTLDIPAHRFTAVMGSSGSGKSTLMHIMAGLESVSDGQVFLGNVELTGLNDNERTVLRRRHVGFVFQAFNLVPTLDVASNIRLPFELDGRMPTPKEASWISTLTSSLGLSDRINHRPSELSGGQQQRTAIARALAPRPEIIFADEPTGSLDSRTGREVLQILRSAVDDHGQTIVMVTHDPVAASFADNVVLMADGRVSATYDTMTADEISTLMIGTGEHA